MCRKQQNNQVKTQFTTISLGFKIIITLMQMEVVFSHNTAVCLGNTESLHERGVEKPLSKNRVEITETVQPSSSSQTSALGQTPR